MLHISDDSLGTKGHDDDDDTVPDATRESVSYHYVLTFVAQFNATSAAAIQYRCGEHYASTFLGNLLHFQGALNADCSERESNNGQGRSTTAVVIGVKASVVLLGQQVCSILFVILNLRGFFMSIYFFTSFGERN